VPDESARRESFVRVEECKPREPTALLREGEWYVSASALSGSIRKMVLKDNDAFLVSDRRADFPAAMPGEFGYYYRGTRYLSTFEVRIGGELPLVLDARLAHGDRSIISELTNSEVDLGHAHKLPPSTVLLRREVLLDGDVLFERLVVHHYGSHPVMVELSISIDADFADMFEVRGSRRPARGRLLQPEVDASSMTLSYVGLDQILRSSRVDIEPPATAFEDQRWLLSMRLEPGRDHEVRMRVRPSERPMRAQAVVDRTTPEGWIVPRERQRDAREQLIPLPRLRTDHAALNRIFERATSDLVTMISQTPQGLYPYAGIPWYCAPFGRDGSITALQMLPWAPEVARGVLRFQAAHQARDFDDFTDREPGKILHEMRWGEMANLLEIPFVPYYGSVDSTPLFLILLDEYVSVTNDVELLRSLWPHACAALGWIAEHGDVDGDGFVEYVTRSPAGLRNQGWKDSFDGIAHMDGRLAEPPIALCEVQAYVVRAWRGAARLAAMLGEKGRAEALLVRAEELQRRLHEAFWLEDLQTFALALDRDKQPCRVLTTNAGHVLWARAAEADVGRKLARSMTKSDLASGFGLRTLERGSRRYNPLSYHNGSIWPHDNAIVAEGLRLYDNIEGAIDLFTGVVDAVSNVTDARVPELYCGFQRTADGGPVPYPVACAPQAWASGAMLQFVSTMLGLTVVGREAQVCFDRPLLPEWLQWLEVRGLRTPLGMLDFRLIRGTQSSAIEILSKPADLKVVINS
jgi:glycogen debranching enzyme